MDRAHRLGQKRTVTVYRLLMRDTLEDKIMGLQRFKLDVANAAINPDNVSLSAMDTSRLLDVFAGRAETLPSQQSNQGQDAAAGNAESAAAQASSQPRGLQAMMKGLGELADDSLYAEEFDLNTFMQRLGRT